MKAVVSFLPNDDESPLGKVEIHIKKHNVTMYFKTYKEALEFFLKYIKKPKKEKA